jgi:hypothetical protein
LLCRLLLRQRKWIRINCIHYDQVPNPLISANELQSYKWVEVWDPTEEAPPIPLDGHGESQVETKQFRESSLDSSCFLLPGSFPENSIPKNPIRSFDALLHLMTVDNMKAVVAECNWKPIPIPANKV